MFRSGRFVWVLSFVVIVLILGGCGASAKQGSSSGSGQLVLYSAQGYDSAMAKAFQAKTGIKVKLVDDSTGNLVAKIEAERSNPHWDVAWFDGDSTMQGLDNQGMLLKNVTPGNAKNLTPQIKSMVPADKSYYAVSKTAAAVIGYNTKSVPASQAPKDWTDLLKPRFKNATAMNDPSISGPTYPFVAGILQTMGTTQGKKFFSTLKADGMKVFPTNDNTIKALSSGQVKAAMLQDTALLDAKHSGSPVKLVYPSSGVFALPGCISIDKNAPNKAAAKKFIDFVLSPEGQKVMLNPKNGGGDSYFIPGIKGVKPDPGRPVTGIKWITVSAKKAASNENQIKQWFHANITQ